MEYVEVPVMAKTISTPWWAVSDLLLLSCKTAWESSSENVISDLVRRLYLYIEALSRSWEFWTVTSPIHKKPAKATLQAVSKLQSLIESDDTSGDVSCSKKAWVIRVACFWVREGSTLRIPAKILLSQGSSKTDSSNWRSVYTERNAERFPAIVSDLTQPKLVDPEARRVINSPSELRVAGQGVYPCREQNCSYAFWPEAYVFLVPGARPCHRRFFREDE